MTLNKSRLVAASLTLVGGIIGARPAAAQFFTQNFTGDSDCGISTAKTYTAAVDFFGSGTRTVNGVSFYNHAGGSQVDSIRGETVSIVIPNNTGAGYNTNTNTTANGGHNNLTAGGMRSLVTDFFYDQSQNAQTETVTFNGLTVGQTYRATFYNVAFGNAGGRIINVNDGLGHSIVYDENQAGDGNGSLLIDTYRTNSTSVTFSFATTVGGNSFHQYGFTNEVAPEPSAIAGMLAGGFMLLGAARRRRK